MKVVSDAGMALCALLLASALVGQDPLPVIAKWLDGSVEPIGGAAVTVYVSYLGAESRSLPGDADHLSTLQRRIAARGGVVVALVDGALRPVTHLRPARLGLTTAAELRVLVGLTQERTGAVAVVVDRAGRVVHSGCPSGSLDDAVERVLAGRLDPEVERSCTAAALALDAQLWSGAASGGHAATERLLQWSPRDGVVHGLRFLLASEKELDEAAGAAAMAHSLDALVNEPRALAAFADLALRGSPRRAEFGGRLVNALAGASAAAPNDPVVQLAFLRALVASGKGRPIQAQAARVRPLALATARGALELCEILAHANDAQDHRELCEVCLARASELGGAPQWMVAVRYEVESRVVGDAAAAARIRDEALAELGSRIAVNNRCWYLLTAPDQMGRGDRLAAALADVLLAEPAKMDSAEYDTAALALHVNGRNREAVECETAALRRGADRDYQQRLRRYEAARAREAR